MKIEPFGERVALKVLKYEEKTESGLIVSTSKNNSSRGEIVAIGEEANKCFKIGDKVLFVQNTGVNYTDGSEDYKIISTKDVLCKIVEE